MNLILGKTMNDREALEALGRLPELVLSARSEPALPVGRVIDAFDRLSVSLTPEEHIPLLVNMGMTAEKAARELAFAKLVISRGYLEERVRRELGAYGQSFVPFSESREVRMELAPLGTLLHIAAGNVDALPVFSVLEGLLTGNVNILKLPSNDGGLSVGILLRLMEIEPALRSRVFVFDLPSSDTSAMEKMASVADAVIVWGGDEAVRAVRRLADPAARIVEWGHKISFAYVSGEASDDELIGVCRNICDTEQLLCSSCQGVFLDTEDEAELCRFAERFASLLESTTAETPSAYGLRLRAQKTIELYAEELEAGADLVRIIKKKGCSVTVKRDRELAPSLMFRDPWVRPLPKKDILKALLFNRNRLQTAALICHEEDRSGLESLLVSAGVVRVTSGERMSSSFAGAPHDGEFPLRRYMKAVSFEY